jgi:hypothetical protein
MFSPKVSVLRLALSQSINPHQTNPVSSFSKSFNPVVKKEVEQQFSGRGVTL